MIAPLTVYQNGMQRLLISIDQKHLRYPHILVYQTRLEDNIEHTRLFGDTESRRAERWEIIYELNRLALEILGESFHSLCMFKNARPHQDLRGRADFHDLSSVRHYIEALWEVTRDACNLFAVDSEEGIWPPQCERVIRGLSQCRKPILPSEADFVALEITLAYIDELASELIGLVNEFSPNGRKTNRQSAKQRGKIRENLQMLPPQIESAIATLGSLENILFVLEDAYALPGFTQESEVRLPGPALQDEQPGQDHFSAEASEQHPRAS